MGSKVKVWTKQHADILSDLEKSGRYIVKKEYIHQKMGEHAQLYFEVYNWYRKAAEKIVLAQFFLQPFDTSYIPQNITEHALPFFDEYILFSRCIFRFSPSRIKCQHAVLSILLPCFPNHFSSRKLFDIIISINNSSVNYKCRNRY